MAAARAVVVVFALLLSSPAFSAALSNQLKNHPSPYLALHADDPVAWQDWTPAVLARAKREGKLIYLSIGYFSCHWCHVMQRESYRDRKTAEFLNRHFIPVKIDRELEPALDARMMDFVQTTRGMAGWPLNVFLTPKGAPLYATLYLPPGEFLQVIARVETLWRNDAARLTALADEALPQPKGPGAARLDPERARAFDALLSKSLEAKADLLNGGFGEQSKFPNVPQLESLLERLAHSPDPRLREFLLLTLDQMAANGLQDHLGGGFFRYTTDPGWKTPHFEKMLYDNAQLARLYLEAAVQFERADYRAIATRTLDFMLRDMAGAEGAFIASLSAIDAQGVEGGYYLWDPQALTSVLGEAAEAYRLAWGMEAAPPFERGYLPVRGLAVSEVAARLKLEPDAVQRMLDMAAAKLRAARAKRALPRDTKRLAAWNGLALQALAEAAQATGDARYRLAAEALKRYIETALWDGQRLKRAVADGRAAGRAAAEDYAYVAAGLFAWAKLTGKAQDFALVRHVMDAGWQRFYVADRGPRAWRLSEDGAIVGEERLDVLPDTPMPSPSAVLIRVSLALADRADDARLRRRALRALNAGAAAVREDPFWFATHIAVMRAATAARGQ